MPIVVPKFCCGLNGFAAFTLLHALVVPVPVTPLTEQTAKKVHADMEGALPMPVVSAAR